ncbi:MAG: nicotinamide-nucleotide amidohydrolase family protein [Candidatus Dormibacteraeota bacterium]|nr:nicotinamide-nucleotide amidohydrolase family protein [Candidatus Dormibacteraeota bacterium]
MSSQADRPDQEPAKVDLKKIRSVRPREYLIRFAFGASISALAGALTLGAGPRFGGLFLAFPAILPASLTLLEKKEGLAQATADVRGAVIGSIGMVGFAIVAVALLVRSPLLALAAALGVWAVVSIGLYVTLRLMTRVLGEKQYLPEIPTSEAAPVIEALRAHGYTLGIAESCTGGTIMALLTDVPGAGEVIRGGIVPWNEDTKCSPLGVDPALIDVFGVVSPQVAKEMAHRAKKLLGADVGFAITGLEGTPDNGQPRGLTYLAVATPDDRTLLRRHTHDHGAGRNRERDVRTSLQLIQSSLDGEPTR